jgi:hypothetical protein
MLVRQPSRDRLVISQDDRGWEQLAKYGAFLCLMLAVGTYSNNRQKVEQWGGLLGGAVCCMLTYLAFYERSSFEFDRATKKIRWRRRRSWRERAGEIDFYDVKAVIAQRPIGDEGMPSRRVVLLTRQGEFPLRRSYQPDSGHGDVLVNRLKEFLGLPADDPIFEKARQFAKAGHQQEAIRLLRDERKLSLSDASERVEAYRNGK